MSLEELEASLGVRLPSALRSFLGQHDGWYDAEGQWWAVWPRQRVAEDNEDAWRRGDLPTDLIAFGDNGTGNPFCVRHPGGGDEVVRWSWIDNDVEHNLGSWEAFAQEWLPTAG